MPLATLGHFARLITLAIVADQQLEIARIANLHLHTAGVGMFADIRQRLLQDEQHLQLLLGRACCGS